MWSLVLLQDVFFYEDGDGKKFRPRGRGRGGKTRRGIRRCHLESSGIGGEVVGGGGGGKGMMRAELVRGRTGDGVLDHQRWCGRGSSGRRQRVRAR